jgi:hypothetical protein
MARELLSRGQVNPMLRSLKELERTSVTAIDGDVGSVANFLFDDDRWAVRYLVVETGTSFDERRVLISPISFRSVDWPTRVVRLGLTCHEIKNSPRVDTDKPVSRQHEQDYYRYYGYPYYWGAAGLWGEGWEPALLAQRAQGESPPGRPDLTGTDAHLRSVLEVSGYHVQGSDDGIGHVVDFLVDDATWAIRYLVIDTGHWWAGHKVIVAPEWATRISFDERKVFMDMTRDAIKNSPAWIEHGTVDRDYEARLHEHHGRAGYWGVDRGRLAHEAEGAASGAMAGTILGAAAGPPGMMAGAVIGAAAGAMAGAALDGRASERASRTRELDAELGVSGGDIGAPNLKHPQAKVGAFSAGSAGAGALSGGAPAEGPMQTPRS